MDSVSGTKLTRRQFLAQSSALGAASMLGHPKTAAADSPPETKKMRLFHTSFTCLAPEYLAEEVATPGRIH